MPATARTTWANEFGLDELEPPRFFSSVDEINAAVPQPHALRRAFDNLSVDGILCNESAPVIYFREVDRIDAKQIAEIHRRFWNQGVAPILVLIAPDQVHVYSALTMPADEPDEHTQIPALVQTLNRTAEVLRSFIVSVESGEYFHAHRKSFDPNRRVDRSLLSNLKATREKLEQVPTARLAPFALDSLLCRLVFSCYLFDRKVIDGRYLNDLGIRGAGHLREILARRPRTEAKTDLYKLFEQLAQDFNGDLFSDDLDGESRKIRSEHLDVLDAFFHGTDVQSGQQAFWPYDFSIIPIETISAIYEHFLKAASASEKKEAGAFYTPRFLAELVLDVALEGTTTLLDKRFLDPACGSGIFLVGLFNRIAEEWKQKNSGARYERQTAGLMRILRENLCGVDSNRTACQIAAFSLYLAFLDQLSPPDIRELQRKGRLLPHLVNDPNQLNPDTQGHTIWFADFFTSAPTPLKANVVVGNPPWGSIKDRTAPVAHWCAESKLPFPDRQIATAFIWKAATQLEDGGSACVVLPHGILFNHSDPAVDFQQEFFQRHAVERIFNLVDYQRFLFEESEAPALVIRYRKERPADSSHRIEYWSPKADWTVTQAELVRVLPQDRSRLTVRQVIDDLQCDDAPLIWKERFWATPRDWRLLDRLSLMARLRDIVGQPGDKVKKRWLIAEGFQPLGANDDPEKAKTLKLPSRLFIKATAPEINLFLLRRDCTEFPSLEVTVRDKSNKNTAIYRAPHVLITKGFSRIAFADFDASFRHAVRGIHGQDADRDLLIFLTAYLRTNLARFFLFHTSSSWGVSRAEIRVEEVLRLAFPLPTQSHDPRRCHEIVHEVARVVTEASKRAQDHLVDRRGIVQSAQKTVERLVDEYFDIDEIEKMLIADTAEIVIPSVRPTRAYPDVPAVRHSSHAQRTVYVELLCSMLNTWVRDDCQVHGQTIADTALGVGMVILEKTRRGESPTILDGNVSDVLVAIDRLQHSTKQRHGTLELVRGSKVFHKNLLYITKPLGQRFWSRTAALNDADEIAASILMRPLREGK